MTAAQRLFPDADRAAVERFGLHILLLQPVDLAQVVQYDGDIGMLGTQRALVHFEHAARYSRGLRVVSTSLMQLRDVAERASHARVICAERLLIHHECAL